MQTNSIRQQTTRRMTPAQKAAMLALRIDADRAVRVAHEEQFREIQAFWTAAHAAGLTPAELHALDMELMHGADVAALRAELRQF